VKVKRLSATRIKTWLTCKYKYGCVYHKLHPEVGRPRHDYFKLGSSVHKALEEAGKLIIDKNLTSFSEEDICKITKHFYKEAMKEGISDAAYLDEGVNILLNKLSTFEFQYPILSLEVKFNEYINEVPITGAMDRVVEYDKGTICVVDYKTSKTPFTISELQNDLQAGVYDIITSQMYPDKNVLVCFDYVRQGLPLKVTIDKHKRDQNIALIETVYEDILSSNVEDLTPNPNDFCAWCDYAVVCPYMMEAESRINEVDIESITDVDVLASLYNDSKRLTSFYTNRKKRLSSLLITKLKDGRSNKIETGSFRISQRQNAYVRYSAEDAYRLLGGDGVVKCADIKKDKFEAEARKRGVSEEELNSIQSINMSNPILMVKPI